MQNLLGAEFDQSNKLEREIISIDDVLVLRDVNLKIKKGELVCILGDVASGKSSLFSAIIGDMLHLTEDFIQNDGRRLEKSELLDAVKFHSSQELSASECPVKVQSTVSYAAQTAWIQNRTIRENILFNAPYDHQKYIKIIIACQL